MRERRSMMAMALLFVVHPAARELQLQQRQHKDGKKQEPAERGGVAHLQETEGIVEKVVGVKERGIDRTALRHDEGLGEDLQSRDEADDEIEKNVGSEQRQRDVPELLPGPGSIERRGFIIIAA